MAIDKAFVLSALLRHNYLPKQTKRKDEIPPVLSSASFSDHAARLLQDEKARRQKGYAGYDSVEYQLTRFDKVPRVLSIPHPKAYSDLVFCIANNWGKMDYITAGENNTLKMQKHSDGRMVIMNYENQIEKERREVEKSFGKHFVVETDIANCYPSIYSHAIAWALGGFDSAKRERNNQKKWYNQVDKSVRRTKRDETNGIAIGPATSNIIAEIILARVDQEIVRENFTFTRFSDDYTAYCNTEQDSHEFIMRLSRELGHYGLKLGAKKTKISPLPRPASQDWIAQLQSTLPRGSRIKARHASQYLGLAFSLSNEYPDKSVMKYALRSILSSSLTRNASLEILPHALNLAVHRAELLPVISTALRNASSYNFEYLPRILEEHVRFEHSDAISWTLYYCWKYDVEISNGISDKIIASRDCIPILLLYLAGDQQLREKIVSFTHSFDREDLYYLDKYWILLYQLFLDDLIPQPYPVGDRTFEILQDEGVTFVDPAAGGIIHHHP